MGRLEPLLNRLDASKKERGDEFEHLCKWFLENDPIYATQLEDVWLWSEWPDRWGPDAGIDLVARTRQGELWAIQAKHYAPESTVSKADIDSFLSESSRPGFAFRLLIATTDRLSANAKRTLAGQKVPAQALLRSQLIERELVWPDRIGQKPKRRKPHTPRDHQKAAIKDVAKGFAQADRGQIIMACGTGKTLTSLFIAEKLAAKRVLVLVPSLSLLSQTLTEWTANAKTPIEFLPVCSDATVAEKDAAVESTSELGFPVTTDAGEIATFVRRRGDTMRVVFATYQSSDRIEAAQKLSRVPKFDLVIADEAHRCTGNTTSDFATVLDAGKIRADRRLFMTATPRILSARVQQSALDEGLEFASMDDEDAFGPVFHRLTFATAIEQKLLADYQVVILGVDNEEVLKAIQERQLVTTNGKDLISADRLGAAVGLAKAIRKYGLTRLITFHGRVKAASNFANTFPAILDWMPARQRPKGTTETNFVSGEMSAGERKRALHHLKTSEADQVILANARVLTEGIDVPDLDGVAFMDPRNSEVDIVQAVGRAIRKPRGKNKDKIGTIVLPIVIEQAADADAELNRTDYKAIWAVLRALRAHDERLAEQVDALRRNLGRLESVGRRNMPSRIVLDFPQSTSKRFFDSISARLIRSATESWEEMYGCLERFVEQEGHARPVKDLVQGEIRLGQWVSVQRTKRDVISQSRRSRLEALSGWVWDAHGAAWETSYQRLCEYVAAHGDARPGPSVVVDGFRLGQWVGVQRSRRRSMNLNRRERLEALPGWEWDPREANWEDGIHRLNTFVVMHGHAQPPSDCFVDGFRLGQWVGVQRASQANMSSERKARLEALPGWSWSLLESAWETGYRQLSEYVAQFGDARPSKDAQVSGYAIGRWVNNQRSGRANMSSERQARLEALPGWSWSSLESAWETGYRHLQEYVAQFGDARPSKDAQVSGYAIGQWVNGQRAARSRMSPERRERLEALPEWAWNVNDARWDDGNKHLRAFVSTHGHARPHSSQIVDDFHLGRWVTKQRAKRRKLEPEQVSKLQSLPGWVWDSREAAWEEGFAVLSRYVADTGHARPKATEVYCEYRLGQWVVVQRSRKHGLRNDRRLRLEALPGWAWNGRKPNA